MAKTNSGKAANREGLKISLQTPHADALRALAGDQRVRISGFLVGSKLQIDTISFNSVATVMGQMYCFEHENYAGARFDVTTAAANLNDYRWNDKISSIQVLSGRWRVYEHVGFSGRYWDLGPGGYPRPNPFPNDTISSIDWLGP